MTLGRAQTPLFFHFSFLELHLGPIPSISYLFSCFISHREFVDHPDLDQAIDGRAGTEVHREKGGAARCHVRRRRLVVDMGLICPPAIVHSLQSLELIFSQPPAKRVLRHPFVNGLVRPFDQSLSISFVSSRTVPSSAPDQVLEPVWPPSLVLSETASSASPQNRRGVARISRYASFVPLVSVAEPA